MSMIWTSNGDHADMETMSKNKIHVHVKDKEVTFAMAFICTHRYTAEKKDMEGFCPHLPKEKAIKENS